MALFLNENFQIILNKTEGYYFIYHGEYMTILTKLFEKDLRGNNGVSRWDRNDNIIFVPEHLKNYVMKTYENIFP
jgi:hypothetical protein